MIDGVYKKINEVYGRAVIFAFDLDICYLMDSSSQESPDHQEKGLIYSV